MPFRKLRPPIVPTASHEKNGTPAEQTPGNQSSGLASGRRGLWRTGLLLTTSAALGGIAIAIWNRRTLAHMRQQSELPDQPL